MKGIKELFLILLKIFGLLLLLIILLNVGLLIYQAIDRQDTFYVRNANFSNYELLNNIDIQQAHEDKYQEQRQDLSVFVHRLSLGKGIIIAYRWYSNGSTDFDDELFKKLTIWIPELPQKYPTELDLSDANFVKAVYTKGGSAWPERACSYYIKSGTLKLDKDGSSLNVNMESNISLAGNGFCKEEDTLNIHFSAHEINFSELTPWLGLKGEHPYNETYR